MQNKVLFLLYAGLLHNLHRSSTKAMKRGARTCYRLSGSRWLMQKVSSTEVQTFVVCWHPRKKSFDKKTTESKPGTGT